MKEEPITTSYTLHYVLAACGMLIIGIATLFYNAYASSQSEQNAQIETISNQSEANATAIAALSQEAQDTNQKVTQLYNHFLPDPHEKP